PAGPDQSFSSSALLACGCHFRQLDDDIAKVVETRRAIGRNHRGAVIFLNDQRALVDTSLQSGAVDHTGLNAPTESRAEINHARGTLDARGDRIIFRDNLPRPGQPCGNAQGDQFHRAVFQPVAVKTARWNWSPCALPQGWPGRGRLSRNIIRSPRASSV